MLFTYTFTNTLCHQVTIVRKRPSLSFHQLLLCICLLCTLTGAMALLSHCTSADRRFEQFTSRVFREEMTASTLNMHYTIADPAAFGITDYEPVLPLYTSGQSDASGERCSALLRQLSCIAYDKLSPENAFTYTLLQRSLEMTWRWRSSPITTNHCPHLRECSHSSPSCWQNTPSVPGGM